METCKNCGQKTLATLDWACPWCGFPIKRGKRLEMTYSQVVKIRRSQEDLLSDEFPVDVPEFIVQAPTQDNTDMIDLSRDEILTVSTNDASNELTAFEEDILPEEQENEAVEFEAKCEPVHKTDEVVMDACATTWEEAIEQVPVFGTVENTELLLRQSSLGSENISEEPEELIPYDDSLCNEESEMSLGEQVAETSEKQPETETEQETAVMIDITIEELIDAYQQDDVSADERYNDQMLALSGVIAMVSIKDGRDFQYVTLAGEDQNIFRSIKCVFNQDKAAQLSGLERGQELVIAGKFRGSLTSMSLVNCFIY